MDPRVIAGTVAAVALGYVLFSYRSKIALYASRAGKKKAIAAEQTPAHQVKVTALYYYPIKSCGRLSASELPLDELGFVNDRRYLIVEKTSNRFITQRQFPKMALIQPSFSANGDLVLNAPSLPTLVVKTPSTFETVEPVTVWGDTFDAAVFTDESVSAWLTSYIGVEAKLVTVLPKAQHRRPVDPEFDPLVGNEPAQVAFADGFPILLASEESLGDLNARLETPVEIVNFRPNIVVQGVEKPFDEDTWETIEIGSVEFKVVKSCSRCTMPTINQSTGVRAKDVEPLKTLRSYRSVGDRVMFGQNIIHVNKSGSIKVGDVVQIHSRDNHHFKE